MQAFVIGKLYFCNNMIYCIVDKSENLRTFYGEGGAKLLLWLVRVKVTVSNAQRRCLPVPHINTDPTCMHRSIDAPGLQKQRVTKLIMKESD